MNKNKYLIVFLIVVVLGIVFLAYRSAKNEKYPAVSPATVSVTVPATVSTLSVLDDTSTASAILAGTKIINWQTANYPENVGVNLNLIRKISDSPKQFTLVRTLVADTPNDGTETWVPRKGENSNDLYIQVTCSTTYQFQAGCSLSTDPIKVK